MLKKITLFLLITVILVSSLLVPTFASQASVPYMNSVLPLSIEWDRNDAGNSSYNVSLLPPVLNLDNFPYAVQLDNRTISPIQYTFSDHTASVQFLCNSSMHTANVLFYAPYGFGSPDSYYDISFVDNSNYFEDAIIHFSYYITSNDPNTRLGGEFVDVYIDMDHPDANYVIDGSIYPFRHLMTWYGGADVIFISEFSMDFACDVVPWRPNFIIHICYEDSEFMSQLGDIMWDKLPNPGQEEAFNNGYSVGYVDGYQYGFDDGYSAGIDGGGFSLTSWLGGALSGFFNNFTFGGFNLGIVFFLILAVLLTLAVIKMFS